MSLITTCVAALATIGVGTSYADTVAVTGGVTQLKSTSARLNGYASPSSADSAWFFQYASAGQFHQTPVTPFGAAGPHAVSIAVTGLTPHTSYRFRLVVEQSDTESTHFSTDAGLAFTTPAALTPPTRRPSHGTASLRSHRLKVVNGIVSIPLRCSGAAGARCTGVVSLSTPGKHGTTVGCGSARLSARTSSKPGVSLHLRPACASRLSKARNHKLGATLRELSPTRQVVLATKVTLVG